MCDRTPQIRDVIVQSVGKACEEVTDADLLKVTAIRVPRTGLRAVKLGDFSGLSRLSTLNLKRNTISDRVLGNLKALGKLNVLEVGQELDEETQDKLSTAFPREDEHVTLLFTLRHLVSVGKPHFASRGGEMGPFSASWTQLYAME